MLPFRLQKQLASDNKLYTYKDVVELVAFALIPESSRESTNIDAFKEKYLDVFENKMITADRLISYS